jgi:DNA-directed RNA polymerase subunit alpha
MIQKEILLPSQIKTVTEEGNKGTYEIDKLYPGYGHTLGNSLRRVVLSSIPGVSITRVFIDGVSHEFSTIDGVKEDVINIILNLKRVVFKMHSDEPITLTLNVTKAGEVTAADIENPSQVEIINPDQYLFTLEKGKEVKISFEISKGLGYVSKESIKGSGKLKVGEMIMDASFTPIRRASYKVNSTRVGDRTDFNKVTLFIETDGSITPNEAISKSLEIMIRQFRAILGSDIDLEEKEEKTETIATLKLSGDILEKIATHGIVKLSDLEAMTDEEILEIEGISKKELKEIKESLEK